ncbi:hypothetical protein [Haloarchaeobius sp. TZWSO28]|uniref:hypothetical protein n=1 Tax=Haloarchaeobius sp. TZWSO28 TaxID=3446119 RepID=UPI003EBF1E31
MRRRRYLALAGTSLTTLGGCLSDTGTDAGESSTPTSQSTTETSPPTEDTATPTANRSVSVRFDALQPALVRLNTDAFYIDTGDSSSLFLDIRVDGDPLSRDEFSFALAGESHAPWSEETANRFFRFDDREGYSTESGTGLLVFELPRGVDPPLPEATLQWPDGEWSPDDELRRRLGAAPPELSLSVDAPGTLEVGTAPSFRLSVTNEGNVPGRFIAGLNRSGLKYASYALEKFSTLVPDGETTTIEYTDESITGEEVATEARGDGEHDVEYDFVTVRGTIGQDIAYDAPET